MADDANDSLVPALEQSILEAEARKLWRLFKGNLTRYYRRTWGVKVERVLDVTEERL